MSKQRDNALAVSEEPSNAPSPQAPELALTKELTRVEEANLSFYEAFTKGDLDRMIELWSNSPHVRCVHPGWELVVGWANIRQSWSEIFRSLQDIEFSLEDIHVEVSGRTAWVNLMAHVRVTTDEGDVFNASMVTTNIFERIDDQWLMVLHHASNFADDEESDEESHEPIFGRSGSSSSSMN